MEDTFFSIEFKHVHFYRRGYRKLELFYESAFEAFMFNLVYDFYLRALRYYYYRLLCSGEKIHCVEKKLD